jgi:ribonuclease-3
MNQRAEAINALQAKLGYSFKDISRLEEALTHSSLGQGARKIVNNERMEFLGDRVLNLLVAERLMQLHPESSEGDLSKRLHILVSRDSCAVVGRELGLGPALRLPGGETRRGARDHDTLLADALEAVMAALFIDAGLERTREIFTGLWDGLFASVQLGGFGNPKSELQEWAAARRRPIPKYEVIAREGPDHAPIFTISVTVDGLDPERATGRSRQEAEKAAALALLRREGIV